MLLRGRIGPRSKQAQAVISTTIMQLGGGLGEGREVPVPTSNANGGGGGDPTQVLGWLWEPRLSLLS